MGIFVAKRIFTAEADTEQEAFGSSTAEKTHLHSILLSMPYTMSRIEKN